MMANDRRMFLCFVSPPTHTRNQLQYDNTGAYRPLVAACAQSTVYVARAAPLLCFLQINHCIFLRPECPNGFFFFFFF